MAKSWSWSLILPAAVADQGSVDVPTPDYDEARVDPDSAELAIGNDVVDVPEKATVEFGGASVTVTNLTGAEWTQGETVYVYAEAKTPDAGGLEEELTGMQDEIDANAAAITALQPVVDKTVTDIADLETRVAALEAAAPAAARKK
jgi:hypothetical protein